MINTDFRLYNYFTIGAVDEYGQPQTSPEVQGTVKMAIYITSQSIQDNINYSNAQYIGLTTANVDDTYIIEYNDKKLKVLYVNPKGRYKQVFLGDVNE